jgi:hypothetical protein
MPAYRPSTADSLPASWAGEASPRALKPQRTAAQPTHASLSAALWEMILHEPRAAAQAAQRGTGQQAWTEFPRISVLPAQPATAKPREAAAHDAVWRARAGA